MSSSTEIKLGNKECLRYWALLKDTENLGQAVEAAMNLDSIADLRGSKRLSVEQWTQILEDVLIYENLI